MEVNCFQILLIDITFYVQKMVLNVFCVCSIIDTTMDIVGFPGTTSPWMWNGVSATLQSGRCTLSYPKGRQDPWCSGCRAFNRPVLLNNTPNANPLVNNSSVNYSSRISLLFSGGGSVMAQHWMHAGPTSTTLAQHADSVGIYSDRACNQCCNSVRRGRADID